jgi:putative Holliday junction resolvase
MILGIDWGQKKIGLAVAEPEISIASAFGVIENNEQVFDKIKTIVDDNDVDMIVIGKSPHLSQLDNVKLIEEFGNTCCDYTNVAIIFAPEMFSTREAHTNLKSAGKKNIQANDDAEAARIILQQYLDVHSE